MFKSQENHTQENPSSSTLVPLSNECNGAADQVDRRISVNEAVHQLDHMLNSVRHLDGSISLVGQNNRGLARLIQFCKEVTTCDNTAFDIQVNRRGKKVANAASPLHRYYRSIYSFRKLYARDLTFAPQLELFFDCYRRHPIRDLYLEGINDLLPDGRLVAEIFNDFISFMRTEGASLRIRKKVTDWERNTTENIKRLDTYVPALFDRYARLVVIRIDFLYKAARVDEPSLRAANERLLELASEDQVAYLTNKQAVGFQECNTVSRVDIKEVLRDRAHLFENMRGKPLLFQHMVGHVWSLEWSRAAGYHLHCALFFDGSKVHKHEYLADQIGKYWETVITQGRGYHHNCNRNKAAYGDNWAIGTVNHNDMLKRGKLMRALSYLAKKDQYVYVTPSAKCKRFGTGKMPQCKSAAGRPRST